MAAIEHQQVVHQEVDNRHGHLQDEAGGAQAEDEADHFGFQFEVLPIQLEGHALGEREVPENRKAGNALAQHRCQGAAVHAPAQHDNEQEVQHHAGHRADDHGKQRAVGSARRADEVVHAHADDLEDHAQADDAHEAVGVVVDFGRDAGKREQRLHARWNASNNGYDCRDDDTQAHRVAQALLGRIAVALAQAQRRERIAAVADEHAHRHEDGHKRHGGRGNRKAYLAHGLAKEYGVDDVVGAVHKHAHDGGHSELGNELRDGIGSHAGSARIALRCGAGVALGFPKRPLLELGFPFRAFLPLKLFAHDALSFRCAADSCFCPKLLKTMHSSVTFHDCMGVALYTKCMLC